MSDADEINTSAQFYNDGPTSTALQPSFYNYPEGIIRTSGGAGGGGGGGGASETSLVSGLMSKYLNDGELFGSNLNNNGSIQFAANNNNLNLTSFITSTMTANPPETSNHVFGDVLFAYTSPFLIFLGLLGNLLSLIVFMFGTRSSKATRSQYLLCLGISDSIVLLSYVLPEWVKRGITTLDPSAKYLSSAVYDSWRCYTILFLSYSSRFISAWLRVVFTFERFYSIRFPFKRLTFANRVTRIFISLTVLSGLLISSLKPPLMQSRLNLELNAASTTGTAPAYYTAGDNYDVDIKTLLRSTWAPPPFDAETTSKAAITFFNLSSVTPQLSRTLLAVGEKNNPQLEQLNGLVTTGAYGELLAKLNGTHPLYAAGSGDMYEAGLTTTQVDPRMLQALLHVFGNSGSKHNAGMNTSEFIDAMLGEATPNPVCVVRPEYRKQGELYDTLYFGVFIMLLPFLLIIIFDFNVLYVVRHREGQLLTPSAAPTLALVSRKSTALSSHPHIHHAHHGSDSNNVTNSRGRIMSVVGGSSLVPDKLTVMLVLSSCFILLNLPYFIIWSIYSYFIQPGQTTQAKAKFTDMPTDIFNNLSFAARTISGLTYSVNGIIYFCSDRVFRADFISLLNKCFAWCQHGKLSQNRAANQNHSMTHLTANVNNNNTTNANHAPTTISTTPRMGISRVASNATSGHRSFVTIDEHESLISPSQSYNSNKALHTAQQSPKSNPDINDSDGDNNNNEGDPRLDDDDDVIGNGGPSVRKNGSVRRVFEKNVEEDTALTSSQHLFRQRSVHFADETGNQLRSSLIIKPPDVTAATNADEPSPAKVADEITISNKDDKNNTELLQPEPDASTITSSANNNNKNNDVKLSASSSTMVIYCELESHI